MRVCLPFLPSIQIFVGRLQKVKTLEKVKWLFSSVEFNYFMLSFSIAKNFFDVSKSSDFIKENLEL